MEVFWEKGFLWGQTSETGVKNPLGEQFKGEKRDI